MSTFRYKAYGRDGRIVDATITAGNLAEAERAVYATGFTPFETRPVATGSDGRVSADHAKAGIRLPLKAVAAFTFELSSLSKAGLPLDETLRIIGGPGSKPKTAALARALLTDVLGGAQLSEAMAKHPRTFKPDYRAMLAAGETGGAGTRVLDDIAKLLAYRVATRGRIVGALVYPSILLLMSVVSVVVIVSVLVPSLTPIFTDANLPLPGILGALTALEDGLPGEIAGLVALVVIGAIATRIGGRNARIALAVDRAKAGVYLVGPLVRMHAAGRFARALGTLVSAGVPMMSALRIAKDLVSNRHLASLYDLVISRVPEGEALHQAFEGTALVPPASLRLIAVGEETGRLGEMLGQAATTLENEMQQRMERGLALLTPLLTIGIGGGIGALIMSVMSAVLSINDLAFK